MLWRLKANHLTGYKSQKWLAVRAPLTPLLWRYPLLCRYWVPAPNFWHFFSTFKLCFIEVWLTLSVTLVLGVQCTTQWFKKYLCYTMLTINVATICYYTVTVPLTLFPLLHLLPLWLIHSITESFHHLPLPFTHLVYSPTLFSFVNHQFVLCIYGSVSVVCYVF